MTFAGDLRFGVEIEMVGLSPIEAAVVVDDYFSHVREPCSGEWTVIRDASVPDGFELRTPPLTYAHVPLLEEVYLHLRGAGAACSPDTAGLHVHVDAERFTIRNLADLSVVWANAEPALYCLFDVHPRRALRYCRPVRSLAKRLTEAPEITGGDLRHHWSAAFRSRAGMPAKHRGLNLESYERCRTVEFRIFNSVETHLSFERAS
jgi:hypothetical protein